MEYRKKSSVIKAFRYEGDFVDQNGESRVPNWAIMANKNGILNLTKCGQSKFPYKLFIKTPDGIMEAEVGDYVIWGTNGVLYPCKPDVFENTYELINKREERV